MRGRSHLESDIPCEDASGSVRVGDIFTVAVADGAGSALRSQEGSAAVIAAVLEWASSGGQGVEQAFELARQALESLGAQSTIEEFATTLAVIQFGPSHVEVGQVGDSIVVWHRGNSVLEAVQPPERFEYLNETIFVSSEDWRANFRHTQVSVTDINAMAASTDGLEFEILQNVKTGEPYEPFFTDLFDWAGRQDASSSSLVKFIDELEDQSGDDKTLVVAVRVSEPNRDGSGLVSSAPTARELVKVTALDDGRAAAERAVEKPRGRRGAAGPRRAVIAARDRRPGASMHSIDQAVADGSVRSTGRAS